MTLCFDYIIDPCARLSAPAERDAEHEFRHSHKDRDFMGACLRSDFANCSETARFVADYKEYTEDTAIGNNSILWACNHREDGDDYLVVAYGRKEFQNTIEDIYLKSYRVCYLSDELHYYDKDPYEEGDD